MKLVSEEGAAREWVNGCLVLRTLAYPHTTTRNKAVRPGQQQSPWLIFKEEEAH